MEKKYEIPESTLSIILNTLGNLPYKTVLNAMNAINTTVREIQVEASEPETVKKKK
jgi:hypothetical protein